MFLVHVIRHYGMAPKFLAAFQSEPHLSICGAISLAMSRDVNLDVLHFILSFFLGAYESKLDCALSETTCNSAQRMKLE